MVKGMRFYQTFNLTSELVTEAGRNGEPPRLETKDFLTA